MKVQGETPFESAIRYVKWLSKELARYRFRCIRTKQNKKLLIFHTGLSYGISEQYNRLRYLRGIIVEVSLAAAESILRSS